jgi:hypothetical protein
MNYKECGRKRSSNLRQFRGNACGHREDAEGTQDRLCPGRDYDGVPPEYKSEWSLLEPPRSV